MTSTSKPGSTWLYILRYPHRSEVCDQEKWEQEKQACFKLGVPYVVKIKGNSKELLINVKSVRSNL